MSPFNTIYQTLTRDSISMVMFRGKFAISLTSQLIKNRLMSIREMSAAINADCAKSLLYKEYGEPVEVLQMTTQTIEQPANDQVNIIIMII